MYGRYRFMNTLGLKGDILTTATGKIHFKSLQLHLKASFSDSANYNLIRTVQDS